MQKLNEFLGSITQQQWEVFQGYGYFFLVVFMVIILYGYWFHLYRSEKKSIRNYECYGRLALDDEINDEVLEKRSI